MSRGLAERGQAQVEASVKHGASPRFQDEVCELADRAAAAVPRQHEIRFPENVGVCIGWYCGQPREPEAGKIVDIVAEEGKLAWGETESL